jgi:hypothetical protein
MAHDHFVFGSLLKPQSNFRKSYGPYCSLGAPGSWKKVNLPIWKSLEEWVTARCFARARAEGWFDALMYYGYEDLRTEQAWTTWERTKADWRHTAPVGWPTLEQWTSEVLATRSLAHSGTAKARAVHALGTVEAPRLRKAVTELLETRALVLWVDSVSKPGEPLDEAVTTELRKRCPGLLPAFGPGLCWPIFFRASAALRRIGFAQRRAVGRVVCGVPRQVRSPPPLRMPPKVG